MLKLHACNFHSLRPAATIDPALAKPLPRCDQLRPTELFQSLAHVPAKTIGDHIHIPTAAILSADRTKLGLVIAIAQRPSRKAGFCRLAASDCLTRCRYSPLPHGNVFNRPLPARLTAS